MAGSCASATRASSRYTFCFFFQAEDGIRDVAVTGVQTCALPISWRPLEPQTRSARQAYKQPEERVVPTRTRKRPAILPAEPTIPGTHRGTDAPSRDRKSVV